MADGKVPSLAVLQKDPANAACADCGAPGPRWASWNIGVFLCVRCAGVHRGLGAHISKIKSVNLDAWTPEQLASMAEKGNAKVNAFYLAKAPPGSGPANLTDSALQQWVRSKYERCQFTEAGPANKAQSAVPEFLEVTVTDPKQEQDASGGRKSKYTSYLITATTNMPQYGLTSFAVRRRYNEFRELHTGLMAMLANRHVRLPAFPPKTTLGGDGRFASRVVEARRASFENILVQVSQIPDLRRSEILREFLTQGAVRVESPIPRVQKS